MPGLTDTERSVSALATDGLTNREIGERLLMSRHTVDAHLRSIYRKLGVNSRLTPINAKEGESAAQAANRKRAGMTGLTDTERSVAALATQGLTNREVAERLFMSRYTVDSHLRSIYRKLGVNSRLALTRAVMDPSDIR